jgi:hypothetical protein
MDYIKYISSKDAYFYKNNGGFLGLKLEDKDFKRVSLHRSFPLSYKNSYIAVKDKEDKEIGIIKDLEDFPKDTVNLFKEELDRRYLLPSIDRINSIKEEFGYSYWDVITNIGTKRFTIKKDNSSFLNVKDNRILVIDVDGNRYEISDYTKLDSKSYKLIELLL